jgi:DNA-directed RNA polymerase specialized sigma24 family protein
MKCRRDRQVPGAHRTAIFLVCIEGHFYKMIVERLGVPMGTAMSRLAAARAADCRR